MYQWRKAFLLNIAVRVRFRGEALIFILFYYFIYLKGSIALTSNIKGNVIEEFVRLARSYRSIKVDEEKKKFIEVEPLLLQKIEEVCHQKCKYKILINKISN